MFRAAAVQMNPRLGDLNANRAAICSWLAKAAERGAELVVFPECALSGYVYDSLADALPAAETVPGETTDVVVAACARYGVWSVVGMLERLGEAVCNTAFVAGPEGLAGVYRKAHLPTLGVDRFASAGAELPVLDLPFGRLAVLICYDLRFPEASRVVALDGADVIALPTNWPQGADSSPDFVSRSRAWENRVWLICADRVGAERDARFIGRSQIVSPDGRIVVEADGVSETVVCADIDPATARQKRLVFRPGAFELDPVGDRRPELYASLVKPR